jgi:hypothetical protein
VGKSASACQHGHSLWTHDIRSDPCHCVIYDVASRMRGVKEKEG